MRSQSENASSDGARVVSPVISDYLDEYFSNDAFKASVSGAVSAWRGFELQTLYICLRMLEDKSEYLSYLPESVEDLLVVDASSEPATIELVQVKSSVSSEGLSFSAVAPRQKGKKLPKEDSFFGHARFFLERGVDVSLRLVVFGKLGDELRGYSNGDNRCRESILAKVKGQYGEDVEACAREHFTVEALAEEQVRARVDNAAGTLLEVAACPTMLVNATNARVRHASRFREVITRDDLRRMVQGVGEDIVSFSGYESQYGRTLFSLSERFSSLLSDDELVAYRQGTSAAPEHIASGFDVVRPRWMDAISGAFQDSDVVLVAGASGQGKSTLCYRYLFERTSVFDGYLISGLRTQEEAQDVCACLLRIAENNADALTYAYIDGAEEGPWIWVAEQVSERSNGKIKLLVSIREDSMNRFNGVVKRFDYRVIDICLSRGEAEGIYASYGNTAFPSFEESWLSFGEKGPLMEYTASLSSGVSLQARLFEQVSAFCRNAPSDSWVYALYLASLLGSEGISVETAKLKEATGCDNVISFVEALRNEHLVKVADNGTIAPVHPYRSRIIAGLLCELVLESPERVRADVVRCASWSAATVLVHICNDPRNAADQACSLVAAANGSWESLSEMVKYALWADTRVLYADCAEVRAPFIERRLCSWLAFAAGGGVSGTFGAKEGGYLSDLIAKNMGDEGRDLFRRAAEYEVDYAATRSFLRQIEFSALSMPRESGALTSAGFVLTQLATQGVRLEEASSYAAECLGFLDLGSLPLESLLDFTMGAALCGCSLPDGSIAILGERIDCECGVVWKSSDEGSIDLLQVPKGNGRGLNDELVAALAMYRKLRPGAKVYAGRQVGVDALLPAESRPALSKRIPARNLPIYWRNVPDRLFISMCNVDDSPDSWDELAGCLREIFSLFMEVSDGLSRSIDKCFEKGVFVPIKESLGKKVGLLAKHTSLARVSVPKAALDCAGFCEFGSPIDPRQARKADAGAVPGSQHEGGMLRATVHVVNAISNFMRFCAAPLQKFKEGESDGLTHDTRLAAVNLAEIAKGCDGVQAELAGFYSSEIVPKALKEEATLLCCLYNKCLTESLRVEHGVRYAQRQRARMILCGGALVRDAMIARGFKARYSPSETSPSFLSEVTESFEEAYRDESVRIFGPFGGDDALAEYFLLPQVLGDVCVDYLLGGCYLGSVSYPSFQLLGLHGEDHGPLASPKREAERARQLGIATSSVLEAYSAASTLCVLCSQCAEVNSAVLEASGGESPSDAGYVEWRELTSRQLEDASAILKSHIELIFSKVGEPCAELLSGIDGVVSEASGIVDASGVVAFFETLKSTLITLDPVEFVFNGNAGDGFAGWR